MDRRHPPWGMRSGQQPSSAASARVAIDQGRTCKDTKEEKTEKAFVESVPCFVVVYVSLALEMKAVLRDKSDSESVL